MAEPPFLTVETARAWFDSQLPDTWFTTIDVLVDRDEIMVLGTLPDPPHPADDPGDGSTERAELESIAEFRDATRERRVSVARRAEAKFQRKVAWGVCCGATSAPFSHLSLPVMTRLRIDERQVLDTLVGAGVARSRSDALVWCIRRVGEIDGAWLDELRQAIATVDAVRARGGT